MDLVAKRKELKELLERRNALYQLVYGQGGDRGRALEYQTLNNQYYKLTSEIGNEESRIAQEEKDARLLAEGKTRENANKRLAEITAQVKELLEEAEGHANDFDLSFSISTKSMYNDLDYDGRYGEYDGWDSSNC